MKKFSIFKKFFSLEIQLPEDKDISCEGKVRYGHEETAERAAYAMMGKGSKILEPYKCRHCDGWHIGGSL